MNFMRVFGLAFVLCFSTSAFAQTLGLSTEFAEEGLKTIAYHDGKTELEGYWMPTECPFAQKTPVVVIVHQWMGPGDYEKKRAEQLAGQCYNVFVLDMYGKDVRPENKEEAKAQSSKYKKDITLSRHRMQAALDWVRKNKSKTANVDKIAVMGYCFGGQMALELARSGEELKGVVSFHGGLKSSAPVTKPGVIKTSLQVHHGVLDPFVPQEQVQGFISEMNVAKVDWQMTQYAGAVHAFTQDFVGNDPSTGVAYNAKADARSWDATIDFLAEIFADEEEAL